MVLCAAMVCLGSAFFVAPLSFADERVDRLPEHHRNWLERDVVYIILERERELFLTLNALGESHYQLGTVDGRESFERSISLDPDQPAVQERLDSLTPQSK